MLGSKGCEVRLCVVIHVIGDQQWGGVVMLLEYCAMKVSSTGNELMWHKRIRRNASGARSEYARYPSINFSHLFSGSGSRGIRPVQVGVAWGGACCGVAVARGGFPLCRPPS